jgi:hypothetical protein
MTPPQTARTLSTDTSQGREASRFQPADFNSTAPLTIYGVQRFALALICVASFLNRFRFKELCNRVSRIRCEFEVARHAKTVLFFSYDRRGPKHDQCRYRACLLYKTACRASFSSGIGHLHGQKSLCMARLFRHGICFALRIFQPSSV